MRKSLPITCFRNPGRSLNPFHESEGPESTREHGFAVRPASLRDVPWMVAVHQAAFPGFFLTLLGAGFLRELYAGFIGDGSSLCYIADGGAGCLGFAVGTTEPAGFFERLLRRRWHRFLYAGIGPLMRHPVSVLERFLTALFFRGERPPLVPDATLLSSLAVHPEANGRGIGVALVDRFCRAAEARGSGYVYLLTDQNDNERVNGFYRLCGFGLESSYRRRSGRVMNRYLRPAAARPGAGCVR